MDATDERFAALLSEQGDRIYRICCGYVQDPDDRSDVYQAVLIHLWQGLGRFRGEADVGTWVYRVTVNTCLTHLRSEQRRQRLTADPERAAGAVHPAAVSGDAADPMAPDAERLYACVQALPPTDRLLVSLYLADASSRQMADVLCLSVANVRVKLHRARQALKAIWEKTEDGT